MSPLIYQQLYSPSLELLLLVIVTVANIFLAYIAYRSAPKNATNIIFSLLSIFTVLWLANNYATNHTMQLAQFSDLSLLLGRFGILWAALMSALFFLLAHTIPHDTIQMSRKMYLTVIGATLFMMLLNVSPYAFVGVAFEAGSVQLVPGLGLLPFSIISTLFSVLAIFCLTRKYYKAEGDVRHQLGLVLAGMLIMLALIVGTVLVPILLFNSLQFLAFTPVYTLVFLGMTAYAITKYRLFNIKVLVTEALTIAMSMVLFAKLFGEETLGARIIDVLMLVFMTVFGFFLVRSVRKEVRQRKEIEQLSDEKSEFMSFASHEIRNPITVMRGYASLILDGSGGEVSEGARAMARKILIEGTTVLDLISQYLSKSKIELGQLKYESESFDLAALVDSAIDSYIPHAQENGLTLNKEIDLSHPLTVVGDKGKIKEVIGNLIDNAIKYTKEGRVTVAVERHGVAVRIIVSDTGAGIEQKTMRHLFKKFARADASKMNLLGTGLGLYLAKTFIETQGGRVWAESEGEGKGSRFIVELPAAPAR